MKTKILNSAERDRVFFNKLSEQLEILFPKGEKCKCGKKLQERSKALVLNAFANIYHNEILQKS